MWFIEWTMKLVSFPSYISLLLLARVKTWHCQYPQCFKCLQRSSSNLCTPGIYHNDMFAPWGLQFPWQWYVLKNTARFWILFIWGLQFPWLWYVLKTLLVFFTRKYKKCLSNFCYQLKFLPNFLIWKEIVPPENHFGSGWWKWNNRVASDAGVEILKS